MMRWWRQWEEVHKMRSAGDCWCKDVENVKNAKESERRDRWWANWTKWLSGWRRLGQTMSGSFLSRFVPLTSRQMMVHNIAWCCHHHLQWRICTILPGYYQDMHSTTWWIFLDWYEQCRILLAGNGLAQWWLAKALKTQKNTAVTVPPCVPICWTIYP